MEEAPISRPRSTREPT